MIGLATVGSESGGIAKVSGLLEEVLKDANEGTLRRYTLIRGDRQQPSRPDKVRFACRLGLAQARAEISAIVYDHVALAQASRWLPRGVRSPYAIFVHGIEVWSGLSRAALRALARANVILANSEYTARRLREAHPQLEHVCVCHLSLPPTRNAGAPTQPAPSSKGWGPHVVLIVGRISSAERYKGHDQLLASWPLVREEIPDAELVVAGTGNDQTRLQAVADRSAARDSIHFTGYVDDRELAALYERAAVFAMPSRGEGFGLVYLEAMQARRPCIGSIHDAASEVIRDGETGYLVDQGNERQLTDAIVGLLRNPALRAEMGEAGYRLTQNVFTYDRFRENVIEALQQGNLL